MFGIIGKTLGTSVALTVAMLFTPIPAYSQIIDDPGVFEPDRVKNVDVDGIVEYIDRVMYELSNSESASLTSVTAFDYARILTWSGKIRAQLDTAYNTPRANWSQSRARMYEITYQTTSIVEDQVTNPGVRYAISFLAGVMSNLSRSESADMSNGLHFADHEAAISGMNKFDTIVANYTEEEGTTDPQSSSFARGQNLENGPQ